MKVISYGFPAILVITYDIIISLLSISSSKSTADNVKIYVTNMKMVSWLTGCNQFGKGRCWTFEVPVLYVYLRQIVLHDE